MAITKEVLVQLKVARPQDGKALQDAAREAQKLDQAVKNAGLGASRALQDATTNARRFHQELRSVQTTAGRGGVGGGLTGTAAIGGGAGGIGAGVAPARGPLTLGNVPVSAAMAAQAGRSILSGITNTLSEFYQTSADEQIRRRMIREGGAGNALARAQSHIPLYGPMFNAAANSSPGIVENLTARPLNWLYGRGYRMETATPGSAAAVAERTAINQQRLERERERIQFRTAATLAEQDLQRRSQQDAARTGISARSLVMQAGERASQLMADRRLEGIDLQFGHEVDAAGRGEGVGRFGTGALAQLRTEMGRSSGFGEAARAQIRSEREIITREIRETQRIFRRTFDDPGSFVRSGQDVGTARVDAIRREVQARNELIELERRDVELTRQAGEHEFQRLERFRQFAQQAELHYQRVAQQRQGRITSAQEQFGLMDELQQFEQRQFAQRISRGQIGTFTNDELRGQLGGLFDQQIRTEARTRADRAGFQDILRASRAQEGVTEAQVRQAEAREIRVQTENAITVNVQANAGDMAAQIGERIAPELQQLLISTVQQLAAQVEAQIAAALRADRLQGGGGGMGGPNPFNDF